MLRCLFVTPAPLLTPKDTIPGYVFDRARRQVVDFFLRVLGWYEQKDRRGGQTVKKSQQ
jgi:hypothetical protein